MSDLEKAALRGAAHSARNALALREVQEWSRGICARVAALSAWEAARTVALYHEFGKEVAATGLVPGALTAGKSIVFPRIESDFVLTFRAVHSLSELRQDRFGIHAPPVSASAVDLKSIDLFVVPLLAFDDHGGRLGYGKGYYDRALARARPDAVKVGLAFDVQRVERVPMIATDIRMDFVVTQTQAFRMPR